MYLDSILAYKRVEVAERERANPLPLVKKGALEAPPCRDFVAALGKPGLSVIAEVKRASPSKGPIRPDLDAVSLAAAYEAGGCSAISVLTDAHHFGARDEDLPTVRASVSVPVLRKDFLLDEYQVWESRAMGADALLLIVAALEQRVLCNLIGLTESLGMRSLVEVHDEAEVGRAADAGAKVVGINNRDLHTFQVDVHTTRRLMPLIPAGVLAVSESGIAGPAQVSAARAWGVDAILVGESLVVSQDPANLVRILSSGF